MIEDEMATWTDYMQDKTNIESIKSYIYLKVKLLFDPPGSAVIASMNEMIRELEVRLNIAVEYEQTD